jgi:nicotinamide mononucleotide transporter
MDAYKLYLISLEVVSVSCNIGFILLLMRQRVSAWIWGIVGSIVGSLLFYEQALLSEALLYLFYAVMGCWGWYVWSRPKGQRAITELPWRVHAVLLVVGAGVTYLLGQLMSRFDADKTYYDAFSSAFGVIATFLEMYKILSGWIYWIVLNGFSIWLYGSKELYLYALLMVVYVWLSFEGYRSWSKVLVRNRG